MNFAKRIQRQASIFDCLKLDCFVVLFILLDGQLQRSALPATFEESISKTWLDEVKNLFLIGIEECLQYGRREQIIYPFYIKVEMIG